MSKGHLSSIARIALVERDKRQRAQSWQIDPVLWAHDFLGVRLWRKQKEILFSIRDNRNTAVAAGHGVGKLTHPATPLATPSGWVAAGDVQVGDWLYDERGLPTRVTGLTEVWTDEDEYEVEFDDGATIRVGGRHEWNVLDLSQRTAQMKSGVADWRDHWDGTHTVETRYLAENLLTNSGQRRWRIPLAAPLQAPDATLPIDPYTLGLWLANGTSTAGVITIGDSKLATVEEIPYETSVRGEPDRGRYSVTVYGLVSLLRQEGLYADKHIPMSYLRASEGQRRALLAGLMDGDGFLLKSADGADVGIDLTNPRLFDDLCNLIVGLGGKVRRSSGEAAYTLDGGERTVTGIRHRANWTPLVNPFRVRGAAWRAPSRQRSRHTQRTIVAVRLIGKMPPNFCIEVDSARHLYLAGRDLIPTHNSFVAAIAMAWWVDVHPPSETFVASTAPFQDQITTILWDNLRNLYALAEKRYADKLIDHVLPGYITGDNKIKYNGITLGQGRKPPDSKADSGYQGLHKKYLLAIGDEAAGLNQDMISALGNITTGDDNRVLLIANPTDPNSAMAEIWKKDLTDWHRMHISVLEAPTIEPDPDFPLEDIGGMSGQDYIDEMERRWGVDDAHYITRVLGQWAFESGNNVFTEVEIARGCNAHVEPDPTPIIQFGCDIARMGPDATHVYEYIEGEVWETDPETGKPTVTTGVRGGRLRFVESWSKAPLVSSDPTNFGSAERIHSQALARGAAIVAVDASGLGGGAIDGLTNLNGNYAIVEVYGSAPSSDKRAYLNVRAEQYFEIKRMLHAGRLDIDPQDEELLNELRDVVYEYTTSGAIKMESKDDMKRNGKKSPDRADAAWYACYNVIDAVFGPQPGEVLQYDTGWALTEADVFYNSGWW